MNLSAYLLAPILVSPVLFAGPTFAQSILPVPGAYPTIQQGIAAAADGDIVLVDPGTYVEQLDFLGKSVALVSAGGADVTTIDSQGQAGWLDFPYAAVIRMTRGEVGAEIRGFTITGGQSSFGAVGGSGVWCEGLSPTIRDCVITGNSGGLGGGIVGDPLLLDCVISDNDALPFGDGGGLYGRPTVTDCVITGNRSGGIGGGIYATGPCTISGTVIDSNISGNGADGYTAGGVWGPVTLVRSQITRNTAHHWFSGGPPDELGVAIDGAQLVSQCTVADNVIAGGPVPGEESGALRNVNLVENSILWNNDGGSIAANSTTIVNYGIVEGGILTGVGIQVADPLFVDGANGDYTLSPTSPAIDAGAPGSALDADGTPADLGAYPYLQLPASIAVRNGSGVNPLCLSSSSLPQLGTNWSCTVDVSQAAFPVTTTFLEAHTQPFSGLFLPFGEVLVDLSSPLVWTSIQAPVGGVATHTAGIPTTPSLLGAKVTAQAILVGADLELCNALDLTLGN